MSYDRVIPRDLFNEAKLLKCLGQLALLLHDGVDVHWPLVLTHEHPAVGFNTEQDSASGDLFCSNLTLTLQGRKIPLVLPYNSRDVYPLLCNDEEDVQRCVFDEEGHLSAEFMQWLDAVVTP
jgi:hypothetical protein